MNADVMHATEVRNQLRRSWWMCGASGALIAFSVWAIYYASQHPTPTTKFNMAVQSAVLAAQVWVQVTGARTRRVLREILVQYAELDRLTRELLAREGRADV